jgi:hypothetical protein
VEPVFVETWLLGPLLMLVVAWGCGLLVRRAAGGQLPALLLLPVGYALTVATAAFLTGFSGGIARLAAPAICVLAGLGLLLERRTVRDGWRARPWRSRSVLWPAGVAFVAFAVVAAPVVLSGHVSYTGYARIVDIAHQFDFTRWLVEHGRMRPSTRDYSYLEVVTKTLDIGYPAGGQSALGAFAQLLGVDIPWVWQVFMAFNGAMLGLALYALLGRAIDAVPLRALAAAVAAQPNILYGYALVGGIKEFTSATSLVATAALLPPLLAERPASARALLPLGVAVAAALAAFSLTIVPWLGVIGAGVVLLLLTRRDRVRSLARVALIGAVGLALAAPTGYLAITKLLPVAGQAVGSGATVLTDLGNLGAPMPVRAVSGIWISGDYRFPSGGDTPLTNVLIVLAFGLVAVAAVRVIRRRDWPLAFIGAAVGIAVYYYDTRTGPWIQFKALTTSAPVVLALAFVGAAELATLARRLLRRRVAMGLGWLAAAVIAGGVLLGNAYAYHDVTLAPHDRIRDLQALGGELHGQPALLPYWEEVGEYMLRRQHVSARPNGFLQIRPGVPLEQQFAYDIDDLVFPYLESQQLLVLRRGPTQSRPPANYRLERRTASYDVWRRVAPPSTVLAHVPSPDFSRKDRTGLCRALVRRAARGGAGEQLAYALQPKAVTALLDEKGADLTGLWQPAGNGAVYMYGPGDDRRGLGLPHSGSYDVWITGAISRPLTVTLDGRRIGTVSDAWSYPGGWTRVGSITAKGRAHQLQLERGGGSLAPGNGADDQPIGPLVFVPHQAGAAAVRYAPLSRAPALCRRVGRLDWIELVRGLG